LRQAISRSPGKSGEVISARSCWSNRAHGIADMLSLIGANRTVCGILNAFEIPVPKPAKPADHLRGGGHFYVGTADTAADATHSPEKTRVALTDASFRRLQQALDSTQLPHRESRLDAAIADPLLALAAFRVRRSR
jgi:hypothetical protein